VAIAFNGTTQYLLNTTPLVTSTPLTVGMWFRLGAVGTAVQSLWALADMTAGAAFMSTGVNSTETVIIRASNGTATDTPVGAVMTVGPWHFHVARFLANNDRRISLLAMGATSIITHANSGATEANVTTQMAIGARISNNPVAFFWTGSIAEFWIADADIWFSGADLPNEMVHQLAFGGPFSIPRVAKALTEYRSFRCGLDSRDDGSGDVYHRGVRQTWTAVGGPTLAPHPPLPYWYQRPGQVKTQLVV
jgi:hypothetical protein